MASSYPDQDVLHDDIVSIQASSGIHIAKEPNLSSRGRA